MLGSRFGLGRHGLFVFDELFMEAGGGKLLAQCRAVKDKARILVNEARPVDTALLVDAKHGPDAGSLQPFVKVLDTGSLLQGPSDRGFGLSKLLPVGFDKGFGLLALFHQGLVSHVLSDAAGLDRDAGLFSLLVQCRVDNARVRLAVDLSFTFLRSYPVLVQ